MFKLTLLLTFLLSVYTLFSQQNFNDYKSLKSEGNIPRDFSTFTYEKVDKDLKQGKDNLSKSQEKVFFKGIHYGIDDILHSGMVIYGDEISKYVQAIAQKLLLNDLNLYSKLRFYTIKSNETNALSTEQGIIFVTTGLISQLTSEAELAFVLAHEISHYTSHHVVESFKYESGKRHRNIRDLSIYSKEKELEADKKGLQLYASAGYNPDELISSFDVLMYSYLPFDEVEINKSYFSSPLMYIPDDQFPTQKYDIKAVDDYDDSESSHPNIKKRKEGIEMEMSLIKNWGNTQNFLGQERFEYIRNICRFESVRTDILDANYNEAIYSIFILERIFPNSIYLKRMKAQAWLGLMQSKNNGKIKKIKIDENVLEGEIALVHYLFNKLSNEAIYTLALRNIYDLRKENVDDKQLNAIYQFLIKELVSIKGFNLEMYSTKTFAEASIEFLNRNSNLNSSDPLLIEKQTSKYDKIKSKKSGDNIENFDSTKFYIYGVSDIMKDNDFKVLFKSESIELSKKDFSELSEKEIENLTSKEEAENLKIGLKDLIVVEPLVFSRKNGEINLVKSEKLKVVFSEAIKDAAIESGLKVNTISSENLETQGTEVFNQRSTLYNFMTQIAREDKINIFPVDFELLNELKTQYGTSKVLFTWVDHNFESNVDPLYYWMLLFPPVYPALAIYFPIGILTGHKTEIAMIILDLDEGKIEVSTHYSYKDTPKKFHLGAHVFNVFEKMKKTKSSK